MKLLVAGDTHGYTEDVKQKIDIAKEIGGIDRIMIVGDFGLWWGYDAVRFIDDINRYAEDNNMYIFAIPGNHDNYEHWKWVNDTQPTSSGFGYLRTRVLLAPRTHMWKWAGKQFASAGGAVSVDKEYRQGIERGYDIYDKRKVTAHRCWEPNEQLTDGEVSSLVNGAKGKEVDYLFTHDCSDKTPFYNRMKPDFDSQIHRQRIDKVLKGLQPRFHYHGHMHNVFDWENFVGIKDNEAVYTQTYGLECNDDFNSWGVLDTADDSFAWPEALGYSPGKKGQIKLKAWDI